jgi:hypothetical protein
LSVEAKLYLLSDFYTDISYLISDLRIVKDFKMKHLSSGDLLRSQILNKTSELLTILEQVRPEK